MIWVEALLAVTASLFSTARRSGKGIHIQKVE
jgi:hypothetical protein